MRIRVRIVIPDTRSLSSLGISLLGHLVLLTAILVSGTRTGATARPLPALTVRLSAGSSPAVAKAKAKAETSRSEHKPTRQPETPRQRPRREKARAPESVLEKPPTGATAQPEELDRDEAKAPEEGSTPSDELELPPSGGPIPGGVAGGVETDEPFTADWYVQLIVARLTEAWRDRPILPAGSPTRRVVVGFTIERDGRVTDARVHVPSGYTPLDYSAQRAVSALRRLPPLPRSYEKNRLTARFVFELVPTGVR